MDAFDSRKIADEGHLTVKYRFARVAKQYSLESVTDKTKAEELRRQSGAPIPEDVLDEVMREMHPHVGAVVLRRWRLPSMLDEPIVCHHDWQSAKVAPKKAAITYFANRLSHRYGFGCEKETADLLADPVCAVLNVLPYFSTRNVT